MLFHAHTPADNSYRFHIWYSDYPAGWQIVSVEIFHNGKSFLPKRALRGIFPDTQQAISQAVEWGGLIINLLRSEEYLEQVTLDDPIPDTLRK